MLILGSRDALQIRHEALQFGLGIRLLYVSDLHLTRWTNRIVNELLEAVEAAEPNLVLLGGDLVDLKNGLPLLATLIQAVTVPVFAVPGNHDLLVGEQTVRHFVEMAGGLWLDTERNFGGLSISGRCEAGASVLCAHDPSVFPQAVQCGFDLVLAGHLHGGQCILFERGGRWYPGALLDRWNGRCFQEGQTTMLVSRGVHDTLPVRWNCPREVLLCSL